MVMFDAVISTPHRISSAGSANCENAIPNKAIARDALQRCRTRF
jgi:hypothetical protein